MSWLKNKFHETFKKARFTHVALEEGVWQVKAELYLKGRRVFKVGVRRTIRHHLQVSIDPQTSNVLSYKESSGEEVPVGHA